MLNKTGTKTLNKIFSLIVCVMLSVVAYGAEGGGVAIKNGADTDSSAAADTIDFKKKKKESLTSEVKYSAEDSVVFYAGGIAYLYGNAKVDYEDMSLTSNKIRINMDSALVQARAGTDSTGEVIGTPKFKEGNDEYESKSIDYNYKTKKGLIYGVITQQGEGYITSEKAKKMDDNTFLMVDGKYTTCDNHEHPHFYIDLTKAKVKPKEFVVTGPAYLVIADVPLPLFIPFGYFPFSEKYSSGLLMPTYGEESNRGFYLRDGGYYFAINDYFDLALRADLYTKGSWGLNATSRYKKRYKYNGNFFASYQYTTYEDERLPDHTENKDIKITWTHSQDPKANPFSTFSASVNYSSVEYNKNDLDSYYKPTVFGENNKSSSINYSYNFPETPFSINANITANQRQSDSTLSLTLPTLYLNMSRIYPLKKKNRIGKEKWYEKTYFNYNINFSNSITTKQDELFDASLSRDWENGVKHHLAFGSNYTLFKYFIITPSVSYDEKWYFKKNIRTWNPEKNETENTYINNFYRLNNISTSIGMTTQLFGFYKPLIGKKVEMIRHVMQPNIGFSWSPYCTEFWPSFGRTGWRYFDSYQKMTPANTIDNVNYSYFDGTPFGGPSSSHIGNINIGLTNNVEMKVASDKDSTGHKKISLIDNLQLSTSYNVLADSLKWADITANLRIKLTESLAFSVNANFTPYVYQLNAYGVPVKVNVTEWDRNHRLARLTSARTSFGYSFSNETFKRKEERKKKKNDGEENSEEETTKEEIKQEYDKEGYLRFALPWNFSFDYTISYNDNDFNKETLRYRKKVNQSLNFYGSIKFSKNWSFGFNSGYDFEAKDLSYTSVNVNRNLHCWGMSLSLVPYGIYQSYNFHISVNSSLLQDLKYEKRSNPSDNPAWY